ncbi:hypothetical protein KW95_03435 [Clostridioides difficile]|nr:hypothetical protein KW95_03435 [Clostridioides difficile]MDI7816324.1 hypothetical protein [Clostridioides difficile]
MKLHKKIQLLFLMLLFTIMLTSCSGSAMSYTFEVETGDKIKVKLDTSDGYSLTQKDGKFTVKKDDEEVLQGIFTTKEGYEKYQSIKTAKGVKVLEDKEKDENKYFFYEFEGKAGTENNFVLWVKDSNTGVVIGSLSGEEEAKSAFERLSVTL